MKIKELRMLTGMSQRQFAAYFGISVRTMQEWEQERREPPAYLFGLLKRILDLEYFKKAECDTIQTEAMLDAATNKKQDSMQ